MAGAVESMSPYQYAGNNPGMLNDPMGDLFDASTQVGTSTNMAALERASRITNDMQQSGDADCSCTVITDDDGQVNTYLGGPHGGRYKTDPETALGLQEAAIRADVTRQIAMGNGYDLGNDPRVIGVFIHGGSIITGDDGMDLYYDRPGSSHLTPEEQKLVSPGSSVASGVENVHVFLPGGPGPGIQASSEWFKANKFPVPWYGNFLGPGPDRDPYTIIGPNGSYLKPIDMLDAAAQRHDNAYNEAHTGGIDGAMYDLKVRSADSRLAWEAQKVLTFAFFGLDDLITGKPISVNEVKWALGVTILFGDIAESKYARSLFESDK